MRTNAPVCSVIIPVYNKWELTRNCLASLREHSAGHDLEVIVVDNGSSDATATDLAAFGNSLFDGRFTALIFPENRNFGPACNAGARAATSPMLFFLNNDTLVTQGWLPPLLDAVEDAAYGAVGPLLLYGNDTVQHLGVTYGVKGPFHLYQEFPCDHPVVARARDLQALTGAALMIRADVFRDCGEFFEEYQNGFEDLDLCVQIRKRDKKLRCVPASRVYHLESQTPGRKAGDLHNSDIFTQRCGDAVFTDVHHHCLRDGFSVFISDLLTVAVKLKEKDECSLAAEAAGHDAALWLHLVQRHPFWVRGREVLAQSLEQAGRQADAVLLRLELADIEPTMSRFRDVLRLAAHDPGASWKMVVERHIQEITMIKNDRAFARKTVQAIRQRFSPGGDPFLEQAFDAKLQALFPAG